MKRYKFRSATIVLSSVLTLLVLSCGRETEVLDRSIDHEEYLYSHRPMPLDTTHSLLYKWAHKEIRHSMVIDSMESMEGWEIRFLPTFDLPGVKNPATVELSADRAFRGGHSLRFRCPTKLDFPLAGTGGPEMQQRHWGSVYLTRHFEREDFSRFNRVSVCVYPEFNGFEKVHLLMELFNDGRWQGRTCIMLENHQWNKATFEVSHLERDRITGISLVYRLQGNEAEAAGNIAFYTDQLSWEQVVPDDFEGWDTDEKISYCHSGYDALSEKTAFTSINGGDRFQVIALPGERVVLDKKVHPHEGMTGRFNVFDFSEVTTEGTYRIVYGDYTTMPFPIGKDIWRIPLLKTLNLFFCQRCGYDQPGIHRVCHSDWYALDADGDTVVLNGGWHDAGDLSQFCMGTAEATGIMFRLAKRYEGIDEKLSGRLIEEARWGLDWLHRNRFGQGRKATVNIIDTWTDGLIGNVDDKPVTPDFRADFNYHAIVAETEAATALEKQDPELAALCLENAAEDWEANEREIGEWTTEYLSMAVWAGAKLFEATGDSLVLDRTLEHAGLLMSRQQQEPMDWEIPLNGFFYRGPGHDTLFFYHHWVVMYSPVAGLVELCRLLPSHPGYRDWLRSVELYAGYLKTMAGLTAPYHFIPAGVYKDGSHPRSEKYPKNMFKYFPKYDIQVRNGLPLDEDHYLRVFPASYMLGGGSTVYLSHAVALADANRLLMDSEIQAICRSQLEWIAGKNPFCQSLMYGEGYDFSPQYSASCGYMVGGISTGIGAKDTDIPYWPASGWKDEVWTQPSARWLELVERMDCIEIIHFQ